MTSTINKSSLHKNIILEEDIIRLDDIVHRWNLPEEAVIDLLFKLRPPAFCPQAYRNSQTIGPHYYCTIVDYDQDLVDYTGEYRQPQQDVIETQIVFNLKDIMGLEEEYTDLYCHNNTQNNKNESDNNQTNNIKTIKQRLDEFDNCTPGEIDLILASHPQLTKGERHSLLAAKYYLSGTLRMEDIHKAVSGDAYIEDPARQARRWIARAKKMMPSLRA